mmetsp:Transcript_39405/g.63938  ORF Transcript_39405/g.63938 Transcript_39405/m.63938 type:complete len:165 (+) Transcript_39405:172-666(+)
MMKVLSATVVAILMIATSANLGNNERKLTEYALVLREARIKMNNEEFGRGCWNYVESSVADCPATYTNWGATCHRAYSTTGKLKSWCRGGCPSGYTNMGCFCARNAHSIGKSHQHCNNFKNAQRYDGWGANAYRCRYCSSGTITQSKKDSDRYVCYLCPWKKLA